MSENMKLWESWDSPDVSYTKKVSQRGGFTTINAQYQLMKATEKWGPYGKSWGLKDVWWQVIESEGKAVGMALRGTFYAPEDISFPVMVDMEYRPGNDCLKKLLTSARSKALSSLGFGAEIYLGQWEDDQYVDSLKTKQQLNANIHRSIEQCKDRETALRLEERLSEVHSSGEINDQQFEFYTNLLAPKLLGTPLHKILTQKLGCENSEDFQAVFRWLGTFDPDEVIVRLKEEAEETEWDKMLGTAKELA